MRDPGLSQTIPRKEEYPTPTSITLYNLLPPTKDNEEETSEGVSEETFYKRWFRPEYASSLLAPVRLRVLANGREIEGDDEATVLYSSSCNQGAIHPSWDLLDERIQEVSEGMVHVKYPQEVYESMRAKIVVCECERDNNEPQENQAEGLLVADFFLHPTKLRRLPKDISDTGYETQSPPPHTLPPNAILIRYTDGSTRVSGALYDLLLRNQIISEETISEMPVSSPSSRPSLRTKKIESSPNTLPRFDDSIFDTLNRATSTVPPEIQNIPSPMSLLFQSPTDDKATTTIETDHTISEESALLNFGDLERTTSLLDSDEDFLLPTELDVTLGTLGKEANELERMLKAEEEGLRHEKGGMQLNKQTIRSLMKAVDEVNKETRGIQKESQVESKQVAQLELILKVQRIKLIQELWQIYPILSFAAEKRCSIRGLEIPINIYDYTFGVVGEEEISAALGFLCHTVVMLAKYLSIPLRYRIVCNSSRSAIQEDNGHVTEILPLFQARMVEREKVERGMILLGCNVECLLLSHGIRAPPSDHILFKVKCLFDTIMDQ